jgi:hypothetical protein
MVRVFTTATFLSCFIISASAQTPLPQGATTQAGTPAAKPAVKKSAPKTKTGAKPATESGPCQIGVIPFIGDVFVVQKVGLMVFGNEYTEVSTNGWGLDDLVVARIRAAAPGVAVRKIAAAKDAFATTERTGGLSGLFRDTNAELVTAVRQIVAGTPCKRYVLVNRSSSQFSNTNQDVRGIGIVGWAGRNYLFALSYVRVFDGEDFSILKRAAASTDEESLISRGLGLNPIRGPSRRLEDGSFPASPGEAVSNPALRDGVRALLAASLDQTIPTMLAEKP